MRSSGHISSTSSDGLLKLLWIDDQFDDMAPVDIHRNQWIAISGARNVEELSALDADGQLPFDVYLTDLRLCDARAYQCEQPAHIESGIHAPAAGLLLGLFTALRYPFHPQCIVPYSGYDEEFRDVWKLCGRFCPESVSMVIDSRINKNRVRSALPLIKLSVAHYRDALTKASQQTLVHVPLGERDRWEKVLFETCGNGGGSLPAEEKIWFTGEWGVRPMLLGSLFYDLFDEHQPSPRVPAAAVREWMSKLPLTDPEERRARKLAEFYWRLRNTEISEVVYSLMHRLGQGAAFEGRDRLPSSPPLFPSLLDLNNKKKGSPIGDHQARLTILFLLIRLQQSKLMPRPLPQIGLEYINHLADLRAEASDEHDEYEMLRLANEVSLGPMLQEALAAIQESWVDAEVVNPVAGLGAEVPVSEEDVVRLINPLPDSWDAPLSLATHTGLGKAYSRLGLDLKRLVDGDGSTISHLEMLIVRRYAREFLPQRRDWPRWLGGDE